MPAVVWFRRDPRVHDNPSLVRALREHGEVIPLFVLDPRLLDGRFRSVNRIAYMFDCLRALDHELREQGVRVVNVAPGGIATDFAIGTGRTRDMPELEGMLSAEEVADVVLFAVTRPRDMRMMTIAFRPMSEGSWG